MSGRGWVILFEITCVAVIVGCGVAIAVPKSAEMRRRAAADRVLADVEVVRNAVYRFYSDSAYFPAQAPGGLVPESLEAYLPPNFVLRRSWGEMEYRNWPVAVHDSTGPASNVVGVSLLTPDARIGAMAIARARSAARFSVGRVHTFLFFGA